MIRSKGCILGVVLLAFVNIAFAEETEPDMNVKVDFIEDLNKDETNRIVSGWDALPGQHPHQVSLRHVNRKGDVSGCGGVLIHRSWVLTAAHCIAHGSVTTVVRGGVTDLTTPEYISETNVAYNYPMYDWSRPLQPQPDDIALVRLMEPVPYTKLAKPIRIQSRADAFRDYSGQVAYTSGFGRTWSDGTSPEVLQWVFLNVTSNAECRVSYGSELVTSATICAGPYNLTSQSICQGDSGGPLVHIGDDGIPTLIGIASFIMGGEHGCHSGYPGAFVRPGAFLDWIREVTGLDFENLDLEEEHEMTTNEPTTNAETPTTTLEPESGESSEASEESSEESKESTEESKESSEKSKECNEETEEESSKENSFEADPELKELVKRLEVQVNVKVKFNKFKKRHEVHIKHEKKKTKKY